MKYILNNQNTVIAVHEDTQDVAALYPNLTVWQSDELHRVGETVTITVTVDDYDRALEAHLYAERAARGYTTREPDYYVNSSVPRWKQDAQDWITHRDAVMLYGLDVMNKFEAGEEVPTLAEFKAALPKISWTLEA